MSALISDHSAADLSPPAANYLEQAICLAGTWAVMLLLICLLHIGSSPYLAFALGGSFFAHIYLGRDRTEIRNAILLGISYLAANLLLQAPFDRYIGFPVGAAGAFCGCGSLTILALKLRTARGEPRHQISQIAITAALVPVLCTLSLAAVSFAARITPFTFDYVLYRADRSLGIDTFALGRAWIAHPSLIFTASLVCNALPLYIGACLALLSGKPWARRFQIAVVALGVVGFALYQLCPAAGPVYRFPAFRHILPTLQGLPSVATPLQAPAMNAMPSLHLAWALLCLFYVYRLGIGMSIFASLFVLLTAIATVGSGQHYVVDLIAAVPFSFAAWSATSTETARCLRISLSAAGMALTIIWIVAARLNLL